MNRILGSRPAVATVAAIAASAVVLATTTVVAPSPTIELSVPRTSTEIIELVALPEALAPVVAQTTASANQVNVGQVVQNVIGSFVAGIGGGALLGFIAAGTAASGIIYQIPVIGIGLSPLIPVIAIVGAIVGAPIGAVVGAFNAIRSLAVRSSAPPAAAALRPAAGRKPAVSTSQRSTKSDARSNRHVVKPPAPAARKAAVPQHRSETARAGSGRGHTAAANRPARH